jgi:hypothetical protein
MYLGTINTKTFVIALGGEQILEMLIIIELVYLSRYSDWLRAGRPVFESRQEHDFSRLRSVQTGSGVHPASYATHTGGDFPSGEAAGARS